MERGGFIESQLKKGTLELAILAILAKNDNYGYPIAKLLAEYLQVKETTVYLILQRLEKQCMIAAYTVDNGEKKIRKYYTLTEHGKIQLDNYTNEWKHINRVVNTFLKGDFNGK